VTYGINYSGSRISEKTSAPGMIDPVQQWTPSPAVCGMDFYTGDRFPNWKGNPTLPFTTGASVFASSPPAKSIIKN
jgi:glucose/arabinose dehydrogenase